VVELFELMSIQLCRTILHLRQRRGRKIDEGKDELRQLVAGIKEAYNPEELIGKQIVFLANLEPKELRGELSHGMILAAVEGDELAVLTTDKKVPNNAKVQ